MFIELFENKIGSFDNYIVESSDTNNTESKKNYDAYVNGKEPLKYPFITHREGNSAFDYVKSQVTRNFWVLPKSHWDNVLKKHRTELNDVLSKRMSK